MNETREQFAGESNRLFIFCCTEQCCGSGPNFTRLCSVSGTADPVLEKPDPDPGDPKLPDPYICLLNFANIKHFTHSAGSTNTVHKLRPFFNSLTFYFRILEENHVDGV